MSVLSLSKRKSLFYVLQYAIPAWKKGICKGFEGFLTNVAYFLVIIMGFINKIKKKIVYLDLSIL